MVFAGFYMLANRHVEVIPPLGAVDAVFVKGNFDVSSATRVYQDTLLVYPTDIEFSPDGLRMYVSVRGSTTVYQYLLTTAWDVSTASQTENASLTVSNMTYIDNIEYKKDGSSLYVVGSGNVAQFNLTTAYSLASAGAQSTLRIVPSTANVALAFSNTATNNYLHFTSTDSTNVNTISTLEIATPFANSTFLGKSANLIPIVSNVTTATDMRPTPTLEVSGDGTRLYQVFNNTSLSNVFVVEYKLGTANNPTTLTSATQVEDYLNIATQQVGTLKIRPDGSEMYIAGSNTVSTYSLDLPVPITYISFDQVNTYDIFGGTANVAATGTGQYTRSTTIVKKGSASAVFNGTSDYTLIPSTGFWASSLLSVSLWVNFRNVTTGAGEYIGIFGTNGNIDNGGISVTYKTDTIGIYFASNSPRMTATYTFVANIWYNMCVVFDATVAGTKLYINGVSQALTLTGTGSTAFTIPQGKTLFVGGSYDQNLTNSPVYFLNGYIDHFRVYNVILNDKNVTKLFLDDLAPPRAPVFQLTYENSSSADVIPSGVTLGGTTLSTLVSNLEVYTGNYCGNYTGTRVTSLAGWTAFTYPFTFSMWLRHDTSVAKRTLFASSGNFNFYLQSSQINIFLGSTTLTSTTLTFSSEWHHFAFTTSGSRTSVYFDGNPVLLSSAQTGTYTGPQTLYIMAENDVFLNGVTGYADDIRIYDYVLSPVEMEHIYTENFILVPQTFYTSFDQSNVYEFWGGSSNVTATGGGTYSQNPGSKVGTFSGNYPYSITSGVTSTGSVVPAWNGLFAAQPITVSVWVFPTNTTKATVNSIFTTTMYNVSGKTGISLELNYSAPNMRVRAASTTSALALSHKDGVIGTALAFQNKWIHVCAVFTPTTPYLYVNGVLLSVTSTGTWTYSMSADSGLRIGQAASNTNYFDGAIDDFRIIRRFMNASEIKALYKQYTQTRIYQINSYTKKYPLVQHSLEGVAGIVDVPYLKYNIKNYAVAGQGTNFWSNGNGNLAFCLGDITSDGKFMLVSQCQNSRIIKIKDAYDAANNFSLEMYNDPNIYEAANCRDVNCGGTNTAYSTFTPLGYLLTFQWTGNILYYNSRFDPTNAGATYYPTGTLVSLGTLTGSYAMSGATARIGNFCRIDSTNGNTYWFIGQNNSKTLRKYRLNVSGAGVPTSVVTTPEQSVTLSASGNNPNDFDLSPDGTRLITSDFTVLTMVEYTLSTPFSLATVSASPIRTVSVSPLFRYDSVRIYSFKIFTKPNGEQYIVATTDGYTTLGNIYMISVKLVPDV